MTRRARGAVVRRGRRGLPWLLALAMVLAVASLSDARADEPGLSVGPVTAADAGTLEVTVGLPTVRGLSTPPTFTASRSGAALQVTATPVLRPGGPPLVLVVDTSLPAEELARVQSAAADLLRSLPAGTAVQVGDGPALPAYAALVRLGALRAAPAAPLPVVQALPDQDVVVLAGCPALRTARAAPGRVFVLVTGVAGCADASRAVAGAAGQVTAVGAGLAALLQGVDGLGRELQTDHRLRVGLGTGTGPVLVTATSDGVVRSTSIGVPTTSTSTATAVPRAAPSSHPTAVVLGAAALAGLLLLVALARLVAPSAATGLRCGARAPLLVLACCAAAAAPAARLAADPPRDYPLAVAGVAAATTAWLVVQAVRRPQRGPEIHDRQVDYIVGGALLLTALVLVLLVQDGSAPGARLSPDLLAQPVFCAGALSIAYGVRLTGRLVAPLGVLLLAWPPLATPLARLVSAVLQSPVDALLGGAAPAVALAPLALSGALVGLGLSAGRTGLRSRAAVVALGALVGVAVAAALALPLDPTTWTATAAGAAALLAVVLLLTVARRRPRPADAGHPGWQHLPTRRAVPRQRAALLVVLGAAALAAVLAVPSPSAAPESGAADAGSTP